MSNKVWEMMRALAGIRQDSAAEAAARRIEALTTIVLTLATETEALRATLAEIAPEVYADRYRETLLLSHNSAGLVPGEGKILHLFFSDERESCPELGMLRRLELSNEEIEAYLAERERVHTYT
jgi:hypothetical protein